MTSGVTWTQIYNSYLKAGTVGNCNSGFTCHAQMNSPTGAFSYLQGQGYMNGSPPRLVSSGSCLKWYGGNMPLGGGGSIAQAKTDMDAWAAAGAKNN